MLAGVPAAGELQAATARSSTATKITGNTPINTQKPAITHIGASIRQSDSWACAACALLGVPANTAPKSFTNVPTAMAPTRASAGAANPIQLHAAAGPTVRKSPI